MNENDQDNMGNLQEKRREEFKLTSGKTKWNVESSLQDTQESEAHGD